METRPSEQKPLPDNQRETFHLPSILTSSDIGDEPPSIKPPPRHHDTATIGQGRGTIYREIPYSPHRLLLTGAATRTYAQLLGFFMTDWRILPVPTDDADQNSKLRRDSTPHPDR